ncbi:MAG: RNA methyltransferase [Fidelibacterota bacterium]|nr:MAG: RNA methyltransferase [Candidatus Neomarinimicrobiota bacterium]
MPLSQRAFKDLRALRLKKHRRGQGRCLVEGARLAAEALRSSMGVQQVLVTAGFTRSEAWPAIEAGVRTRGSEPVFLTDTQAEQLADTRHPQGVFAVVSLPVEPPRPEQLYQPPIFILDDIADPGNLGTLLRTADWFGVPSVWVSSKSADIYNPKVFRGGMGAHFHLPSLWQGDMTACAGQLADRGIALLGAALGGRSLDQFKPPGKAWALVVGSEARGLSTFWREQLDEAITIPGSGQAESLNAAVAGGIILHYLLHSSSFVEERCDPAVTGCP